MKKLLLLLPVGLIAASGFFLFTTPSITENSKEEKVELSTKSPEQLFSMSQDALSTLLRHGDQEAVSVLDASVVQLKEKLPQYKRQGLNITKVEELVEGYKRDTLALSKAIQPRLAKIKEYDQYEEKSEEKFLVAIEQIGLYELKTDYQKLIRIRQNYLKEPSTQLEDQYHEKLSTLIQTIQELYLDSNIEDPLYAYLNNHKNYFETMVVCYQEAGLERVIRLRNNTYAIKTELQLLPTL